MYFGWFVRVDGFCGVWLYFVGSGGLVGVDGYYVGLMLFDWSYFGIDYLGYKGCCVVSLLCLYGVCCYVGFVIGDFWGFGIFFVLWWFCVFYWYCWMFYGYYWVCWIWLGCVVCVVLLGWWWSNCYWFGRYLCCSIECYWV